MGKGARKPQQGEPLFSGSAKRLRRGSIASAGQRSPRRVRASTQRTDGPVGMDQDTKPDDSEGQRQVPVPSIEVCPSNAGDTGDESSDIVLDDAVLRSRSVSNNDYEALVLTRNPQTRSQLGINDDTHHNYVEKRRLLLSQWSYSSELGDDSEGQHIARAASSITPIDYDSVPSGRLVDIIRDALEPLETSNFNKSETHFLPWTTLHKVLSTQTVLRLLRHLNKDGSSRDVRKLEEMASMVAPRLSTLSSGQAVKEQFRRVFATLILVGHEKMIFSFFDLGVNDGRLLTDVKFKGQTPTSEASQVNDLFRWWSPRKINEFKSYRWKLSPKFIAVREVSPGSARGEGDTVTLAKRMQYKLQSAEEVLPFTSTDRERVIGGFAEVRFFVLHKDQQDMPRYTRLEKENPIAVKTLRNEAKGTKQQKKAYFDEVYIMERLRSSIKSPHISRLLATIEVPSDVSGIARSDYHLILEAADRNLEHLWSSQEWWRQYTTDGVANLDLVRWVACQCYGLTDALSKFHNFSPQEGDMNDKNHGLHCDIKPDNILHYQNWKVDQDASPQGTVHEELGVLQLGDFGLSSFHSTRSVENHRIAGDFLDYAAPETDFLLTHSPAADVWHLGCLFVDFATWLLEGPAGYDKFVSERVTTVLRGERARFAKFTPVTKTKTRDENRPPPTAQDSPTSQEDKTTVEVNPRVLKQATYLCEHPKSSSFIRELCHIAVNYMLVIRVTEQQQVEVEYNGGPNEVGERLRSKQAAEILKRITDEKDGFFEPSSAEVIPFDHHYWKRRAIVLSYSVQNLQAISRKVKSGLGPEEAGLKKSAVKVVNAA